MLEIDRTDQPYADRLFVELPNQTIALLQPKGITDCRGNRDLAFGIQP